MSLPPFSEETRDPSPPVGALAEFSTPNEIKPKTLWLTLKAPSAGKSNSSDLTSSDSSAIGEKRKTHGGEEAQEASGDPQKGSAAMEPVKKVQRFEAKTGLRSSAVPLEKKNLAVHSIEGFKDARFIFFIIIIFFFGFGLWKVSGSGSNGLDPKNPTEKL